MRYLSTIQSQHTAIETFIGPYRRALFMHFWPSWHRLYDGFVLRIRFRTGSGCGRSMGKERKWIGSGSEELRSGREGEGLGFNSYVAPSCTQVSYFGKADRTEKETGGTEVDIQTGDTGGNI